jgi:hypothetical protein
MDVLSLAAGFLVGAATTYLVSYFLKPNKQEVAVTHTKNLFDQLWQTHERLLKEIKQDLDNPDFKFHREFYVLKKGWDWNRWGFHRRGPCLAYFLEDHDDLLRQLNTLASHGLISHVDETKKNTVKYRLSEKLVELLRGRNTDKA